MADRVSLRRRARAAGSAAAAKALHELDQRRERLGVLAELVVRSHRGVAVEARAPVEDHACDPLVGDRPTGIAEIGWAGREALGAAPVGRADDAVAVRALADPELVGGASLRIARWRACEERETAIVWF